MSLTPERRRKIEDLYQAALECQPEKRQAFLDKACGDEELRREMESLLGYGRGPAPALEQPPSPTGQTLTPGAMLGPYHIAERIDAGGMGEVYRGIDTRLGRTVAIKVLPPNLAADPDMRRRLEREARAVSALKHPHICMLYDIGRENDTVFLVMEYLEGETLNRRIERASSASSVPGTPPIPLEQVLRYAIEIADALDTAHRRGVVHRDLKPSNIMLTEAGAKLLDFGLAWRSAAARAMAAVGSAEMQSTPLTKDGVILGTLQYIAPERLEGKNADARSDIFAFGAVLYEMVTGRRAFDADSQVGVIAAIMHTTRQRFPSVRRHSIS